MCRDRVGSDDLQLTHEFISNMLRMMSSDYKTLILPKESLCTLGRGNDCVRLWVLERCLGFALDDVAAVRQIAVTCLGHVARINRQLDLDCMLCWSSMNSHVTPSSTFCHKIEVAGVL
jgi:hypothetical protein